MIALNGLPATSVRLLVPKQGAWLADVDFDLDETGVVPTGRAAITLGGNLLSGTIDPAASGRFASHVRTRVVGGGNGWQQIVTPQHSHNDGGVLSVDAITSVASLVGETAVVAAPANLGNDFVRFGPALLGTYPAYQVLRGLDWYVDFTGVTQVSSRAAVPVTDDDVHILSYDGLFQTAQIATDVLLSPGMVLTDSRFDSATIQHVEQTFDGNGARATVWLSTSSSSVSSLGGALGALARVAVGLPTLRAYRYRVVAQGPDGRLTLQAVSKSVGIPDQLPIKVWYGAPGVSGKPAPGTVVVLRFLEGDPGQPIVVAFDDTTPTEIDLAASVIIDAAAPLVGLGPKGARTGVATLSTLTPLFTALLTLVTTINALAVAVNNIAGTPNVAALGAPGVALDPNPNPLSTAVTTAFGAVQTAAAAVELLLPAPTNFSATVQGAS